MTSVVQCGPRREAATGVCRRRPAVALPSVQLERQCERSVAPRRATPEGRPSPRRVIQRGGPRCLTGRIPVGFLAIPRGRRRRCEQRTPRIQSREPVLAIGCRPLTHGVAAIAHEHHVDADDVGQLSGLAALRPTAAQEPAHHAKRALLAQQCHRLGVPEHFARQCDRSGRFGRRRAGCARWLGQSGSSGSSRGSHWITWRAGATGTSAGAAGLVLLLLTTNAAVSLARRPPWPGTLK